MIRLVMLCTVLALGACATIDGLGQDISNSARKVGDSM